MAEQTQRVAIVTGGTRGIGAAVVGALTAAGLAVASFDVQPPANRARTAVTARTYRRCLAGR